MKLFLSALAVCLAGAANATTVTFDPTFDTPGPELYSYIGLSQGFQYEFSTLYYSGHHISLHDDGGLTSSTIRRQDGARFTPTSVDLTGFSRIYKTGIGPVTDHAWYYAGTAAPAISLTIQGIRGNQVVATRSVSSTARQPGAWDKTTFGSAFSGIDKLVLSLQIPAGVPKDYYGITTPGQVWCLDWCG